MTKYVATVNVCGEVSNIMHFFPQTFSSGRAWEPEPAGSGLFVGASQNWRKVDAKIRVSSEPE